MSVFSYSRTRTQGDPLGQHEVQMNSSWSGTECTFDNRFKPDGWKPVSSHWDSPAGYEGRVTKDTLNPGFKKFSAQGGIINNAFVSTFDQEIRSPLASYSREYWYKDASAYFGAKRSGSAAMSDSDLGAYLLRDSIPNIDTQLGALIDQASTRAYSNLSAEKILALVAAAESQKTVDSVTAITRRAYKIMRAAKKFDLKYLRKQISFRELSDRYMEARYAIRPLYYDVRGVVAALEQSKQFKTSRATARGFGTLSWHKRDTITVWPAFDVKRTIDRSISVDAQVRVGILADVTTSIANTYGLDQIAETAWELIPYSFVVDWFCNVGQKIAAFTPNAGVNQLASWTSLRQTTVHSNSLSGIEVTLGGWTKNSESWSGSKTHITQSNARDPVAALNVLPTVNVRLSSFKLLDLVVMMRNLIR